MNETNITRKIMLAIGKLKHTKIFRNNTAMGWAGKVVHKWTSAGKQYVTIEGAIPLHAGLVKGSSDLIGWKKTTVTQDMVGKEVAIFTAIEVKTQYGKATKEQINFLEAVKSDGGIASVSRSDQDAIVALDNWKII
jgi:hypothetical protein